jgi:hypothetical protein
MINSQTKESRVEFDYQITTSVQLIKKIPDARFKSGYRVCETIGFQSYTFPKSINGTNLAISHIVKANDKLTRLDFSAIAEVNDVIFRENQL